MRASAALNVRSGAGTGYGIVRTYPHGLRFTLLEVKGDWGRTPSGWVCMSYAEKAPAKASSGTVKAASGGTYKVTASALFVRTGAGTGYAKVPYSRLTARLLQRLPDERHPRDGAANVRQLGADSVWLGVHGLFEGCVTKSTPNLHQLCTSAFWRTIRYAEAACASGFEQVRAGSSSLDASETWRQTKGDRPKQTQGF